MKNRRWRMAAGGGLFGVRWQSEAATPLWLRRRDGVGLAVLVGGTVNP